jgi:hypothetical protein
MQEMTVPPAPSGVSECVFQGRGLEIDVVGSTRAAVAASRSEGLLPMAAAQGSTLLTTGFAAKGFAVYHSACRSNPAATSSLQFLFDSSGSRAWQVSISADCDLNPSQTTLSNVMDRLLAVPTLTPVMSTTPLKTRSTAFTCPLSASQITSAAGRPMARMTGLSDLSGCTFVDVEPGVSDSGTTAQNKHRFQILVVASTSALVAYEHQSLKPLNPRMKVFRTGFAAGGAAVYTTNTNLSGTHQLVSVMSLYFDGTHGSAWQLVVLANVKLKIPEATFSAIMTRLRALPAW